MEHSEKLLYISKFQIKATESTQTVGSGVCAFGIDNYAKDGGPSVVLLLCSFYHELLHTLIVKEVQQLCDLT